ncbi:hypothetical protein PoB_003559000 [Plakobranchus ocellatus]|uniref:Uncharacterized protein n=1 Tax=Plakobranchus ocellatus TaxID=259542 RepID=A0AAV4ALM1_9GAST|nr:hypothetical protein PoB_003559000 [Plakobranchus ocellatus]
MEDMAALPLYRHHIAEHSSRQCLKPMDFSPTVRQSIPCKQPRGPNVDTHVYPSDIKIGTIPDPKHNVGRSCTDRVCGPQPFYGL